MILLENDFLKTYNKIDSLWEDTEPADEEVETTQTNSGSRETGFKFKEVVKKAQAAVDKLSSKQYLDIHEVQYWCDLRMLLDNKVYPVGDQRSRLWCERFMRFYKAYLIEDAIQEELNKADCVEFCSIADITDHDKIVLKTWDTALAKSEEIPNKKPEPDLKIRFKAPEVESKLPLELDYTIECKTFDKPSANLHFAKLVARHMTPDNISTGTVAVPFWLVGKSGTVKNIKAIMEKVGQPLKVFQVSSLTDKFTPPAQEQTGEVSIVLEPVYANLNIIHGYLEDRPAARQIKVADTLNQQTRKLNKTITDISLGDSKPIQDYKSPVKAADQLVNIATTIADAVKSKTIVKK